MRVWMMLGLLLLVPATQAEIGIWNPETSTPTTLWIHCDSVRDCPISVQPPLDGYEPSRTRSVLGGQECAPTPVSSGSDEHVQYAYYTASEIQQFDGGLRYHTVRGLQYDVLLDHGVAPILTWYVQTTSPADAVPNQVAPRIALDVKVLNEDEISVDHEQIDNGPLIASARTEAVDLHPAVRAPGVSYLGDGTYEFVIPLDLHLDTISDDGLSLRVEIFQDNMVCDPETGSVAGPIVGHHQGAHWAHLDWYVMNPLRIEYMHPQIIGDDVVIHTSMASPWGQQALMHNGMLDAHMIIEGPSEATSLEQVVISERVHEHNNGMDNSIDATWVWQAANDGAKTGLYTATVTVTDVAGPAVATAAGQFEIGTGNVSGCTLEANDVICRMDEAAQERATPMAPVALLLAGLVLLTRANKA